MKLILLLLLLSFNAGAQQIPSKDSIRSEKKLPQNKQKKPQQDPRIRAAVQETMDAMRRKKYFI